MDKRKYKLEGNRIEDLFKYCRDNDITMTIVPHIMSNSFRVMMSRSFHHTYNTIDLTRTYEFDKLFESILDMNLSEIEELEEEYKKR